jgi:hypothetical protein
MPIRQIEPNHQIHWAVLLSEPFHLTVFLKELHNIIQTLHYVSDDS